VVNKVGEEKSLSKPMGTKQHICAIVLSGQTQQVGMHSTQMLQMLKREDLKYGYHWQWLGINMKGIKLPQNKKLENGQRQIKAHQGCHFEKYSWLNE
jgi:hypothetical protein